MIIEDVLKISTKYQQIFQRLRKKDDKSIKAI